MSKDPKNRWKLIKLANIETEIIPIFWTTWGISMTISGKIWPMIILKVRKTNSVSFSLLADTFS